MWGKLYGICCEKLKFEVLIQFFFHILLLTVSNLVIDHESLQIDIKSMLFSFSFLLYGWKFENLNFNTLFETFWLIENIIEIIGTLLFLSSFSWFCVVMILKQNYVLWNVWMKVGKGRLLKLRKVIRPIGYSSQKIVDPQTTKKKMCVCVWVNHLT
jgi:hypothetical protein